MDHLNQRKKWYRRERKTLGIRRRLKSVSDRPRLTVFRSTKHISVQVVDDNVGRTLAAATTADKKLAGDLSGKSKADRAAILGTLIAERAKAAGVDAVVFDRGRFRFHGRVKALAEAARKGGLKF